MFQAKAGDKMKCNECVWQSEETGSCTNDAEECVEGSSFVKALEPEDMFKVLFMLIYNLQGNIDFSREELDKVTDEMKIKPSYDPEEKKYVLQTSPQPPPSPQLPQAVLVKVPKRIRNRKIVMPRKKLFLPN